MIAFAAWTRLAGAVMALLESSRLKSETNQFASILGARIAQVVISGLNLLFLLVLCGKASAFTTFSPPITGASDFVTGFPTCSSQFGTLGPIGVLFDGTHFFVTDPCVSSTYRFSAAGGDASTPDAEVANGLDTGLALKGGVYYGNSTVGAPPSNGLYKFDPETLSTTLVANLPPLVLAIAGDPVTTDLYVSTFGGLYRVQNPDSGSPTVTLVSPVVLDGIVFSGDGMRLYGAGAGTTHVVGFNRSFVPVFDVDTGHPVDGVAVALNNTMAGSIDVSNNIFVNGNDGTLVRIDVNNGNAVSVVASGGSRGDLATVGPDNCLYVTQTDRVEKMSPCFFQASNNAAPDCSQGTASINTVWPPNHKFVPVAIKGITDPDGDTVTVKITSIRQDEALLGTGSGDTCPDATGVGMSKAQIRSERADFGDGRVYHIQFSADDGQGGTCTGAVTVCVPHDQSNPSCEDEGSLFDSTRCP